MLTGRAGERGQTLVMFALATGLFLLGLFAVVVDLSQLFSARVKALQAAQAAALAGASDVDTGSIRSELPRLAPTYAMLCSATGDRVLGQPGATVCRGVPGAGAGTVRATVSLPVTVDIPLFGRTFRVGAQYSAAPAEGVSSARGH